MGSTSSSAPPATSITATSGRPADVHAPSKLGSWVWQHFLKSKSHPDWAWCNFPNCPPRKQKVSRKNGNTTNMIDHMKTHHNVHDPAQGASAAAAVSIRAFLTQISKDVVPCLAYFRAALNTHIAQIFITSCLPFNIADNADFIASYHFATGGSYLAPARTKLTATVDAQYQSMVDVLLADVKNNTISITSDAATLDNGQSYITITAHYITSTMVLRDAVLLVSRMTEETII